MSLYIINLTFKKFIVKIVRSLFIHMFIHYTYEYHVLKTCLTQTNVLINEIQTYE
jgi:hypothetical protein